MNDQYETFIPGSTAEKMPIIPQPALKSPFVDRKPGEKAGLTKPTSSHPNVLVRIPKVTPRESSLGISPSETDNPASIRPGVARWRLVSLVAGLILLAVIPLAFFNNDKLKGSNDIPSWVPECPAPDASRAPAWDNIPSSIDLRRQPGDLQTRVVENSLPNKGDVQLQRPSSSHERLPDQQSQPAWQDPTSKLPSWNSHEPVANTPSLSDMTATNLEQKNNPASRLRLPNSYTENQRLTVKPVENRLPITTGEADHRRNRHADRHSPTAPPEHRADGRQRYQMANRPPEAISIKTTPTGPAPFENFAPRNTGQSNDRASQENKDAPPNKDQRTSYSPTSYQRQPSCNSPLGCRADGLEIKRTDAAEPGIASLKGTIEKPTIRTIDDHIRPSLY